MARKSSGRTGKKSNVHTLSSGRSRDNKKSSAEHKSSRSSSSHRGAEDRKVVSISHGRQQSSGRSTGAERSSGSGRASESSQPARAHALTDHDQIRRWAEDRGAHPSCVRGTGDREDVGMIRLDFPGYGGEGSLEEITWDAWFDKFDESGLALLVQEQTARGQKSNFNKLVKRETAEARESSGRSRSRRTA